jgi:predicted Zn-dependent peptidase
LAVRVFHTPSTKFKTVTVRVYLHTPLVADRVTCTALVPHVLARGTRGLPTLGDLARRCEELYGASLGAGVAKIGESQSLYVAVEAVEDRFLPGAARNVAGSLALLRELLLEPARDAQGLMRADVLAQEKENLAHRIQALINDKVRYAGMRLVEEMCRGEPFGLHAYGRLEDLPAIDAAAVTARYEELIGQAPVDVFAVGGPASLRDEIAAAFDVGGRGELPTVSLGQAPPAVRRVTETQPVDQGKLCLGYRTPVRLGDPRHAAVAMYSGILGGFPHSKLFRNVREKASLAYYATSRYESLKGIVVISSGIEPRRFPDALRIIEEQVADMAAGRITRDEFTATVRGLRNRLRSAEDSPAAMIELAAEEAMVGAPRTLEERLAAIDAVTPDQVAAVAQDMRLDTVYFLTSREE